jgi:transcriptional regulator with XRE-family HTH domain
MKHQYKGQKYTFMIKKLRIERKLTQLEVANYLKMEIKTYQRRENNNTFTFEEGIKILKYMGYEIAILKPDAITKL